MPDVTSASFPSRRAWALAVGLLLLAPAAGRADTSSGTMAAAAAGERLNVAVSAPVEVEVWNRPIATMRAAIGGLQPAERAANAVRRIEEVPEGELGNPVRVVPAQVGKLDGVMVTVGGRIVFSLLPQDLDAESGETLESIGPGIEERLRAVLQARAAQRSMPILVRGIVRSLAATAVFALIVWALVRLARWLHPRLTAAAERRGGAAAHQVRGVLAEIGRRATQLASWGLALLAADIWLTYVLSQFPYTQPWGEALGSRLAALMTRLGLEFAYAMPGVLTVAIIFILARVAVRLLHALFLGVEHGRLRLFGVQPETAQATRRLSTVLVWLFALTIAYPYIPGSGTDAFRGVSVFVGLMLSLGSAGLVNQVMSGLVVIYARAIRPGEYVKIGDCEGVVSEIGLLSTKLRNARKEEMTIPNAVLVGTTTTNYSRLADRDGGVVVTTVTIGYDAPWRQVEALLLLAAERTPAARKTPAPRVVQRRLDDFYVEYALLVNVDDPTARPTVLHALHAQIQDAFNEFGVQIMSPHFEGQPEGSVVVPKQAWFAAPAKPPAS